jgi:rubrerythrin
MPLPTNSRRQNWRLEDIDFAAVDTASVRDDEFLFLMLASASFVEILSETYSDNLIEHFRGNAEVTGWLKESWQQEEVQHGRALKAYVQAVWPEFDWEKAHSVFWTEYSACCTVEQLESHRALELVARCVVETGTSTFYRAVQNYVREPVLRQLIGNIKADEAAHYTHFRRYFATYNAIERHGFFAVIATIWRRLREIRGEDAYIAFKHVSAARHPDRPFIEEDWLRYNRTVKRHARRHYPHLMAVKMLIKPIPLVKPLKTFLLWPLLGLALLASWG